MMLTFVRHPEEGMSAGQADVVRQKTRNPIQTSLEEEKCSQAFKSSAQGMGFTGCELKPPRCQEDCSVSATAPTSQQVPVEGWIC